MNFLKAQARITGVFALLTAGYVVLYALMVVAGSGPVPQLSELGANLGLVFWIYAAWSAVHAALFAAVKLGFDR